MAATTLLHCEVNRAASSHAAAARAASASAPNPEDEDEWQAPPLIAEPSTLRFELDDSAWMQHLSDHGYVVIAGALNQAQVATAHDLLWDHLQSPGFDWVRGREETWRAPYDLFRCCGILKSHGIGQSEVAWFCRTQPAVLSAFQQIWGTTQVLPSFDGLNIFRPWYRRPSWRTQDTWLHCDQGHSPDCAGLRAVQSFVALTDHNETTGGLCVMPGSHHLHQDWVTASHPGSAHNFCMLEDAGSLRNPIRGLHRQLVSCQAGDLVLWDSRTIHCNMPASAPAETVEGELLRVAVYVCCVPAAQATAHDLLLRRQAYDEGLSCNHWPLFGDEGLHDFRNNLCDYRTPSLDAQNDGRRELVTGASLNAGRDIHTSALDPDSSSLSRCVIL